MNKILVVAGNEFNNAVRAKSFLISVLLVPLMMVGAILIVQFLGAKTDVRPRAFAVVDRTEGKIYPAIETAANFRNSFMNPKGKKPLGPSFYPSRVTPAGQSDAELLLDLSEKVRRGELYAFVEVPAGVGELAPSTTPVVKYYSDSPADFDLRSWLESTINAQAQTLRYEASGIDSAKVAQLQMHIPAENLGLLSRGMPIAPPAVVAGGGSKPPGTPAQAPAIVQAEPVDPIRTFVVPGVMMFIVFMAVMTSAPLLFNSVIEEKMSKISEVLLGSVSSFELMMGKLLGNVGVGCLMISIYIAGGYGVACYFGYGNAVPPGLLAALAVSVLLGLLIHGSIFSAVGAACTDLKDSQSLLAPAMLLVMFPMMFWGLILTAPSSPMAVGLSLFPPASPFLMLMRMCLKPAPPAWQVALAGVLTTLTAVGCVWAAGKVFRTGLLMQGKAPTFRELARWIVAK